MTLMGNLREKMDDHEMIMMIMDEDGRNFWDEVNGCDQDPMKSYNV